MLGLPRSEVMPMRKEGHDGLRVRPLSIADGAGRSIQAKLVAQLDCFVQSTKPSRHYRIELPPTKCHEMGSSTKRSDFPPQRMAAFRLALVDLPRSSTSR